MANAKISVDEFAEVTFNAILRALEARKIPPKGPIIFGIIWFPETLPGGEVVKSGAIGRQG